MFHRWNGDLKCNSPFPIAFATIKKTLSNLRKKRYDTSPKTCAEIQTAFENPTILRDLGTSLEREHRQLFNIVREESFGSYCILLLQSLYNCC